MDCPLQPCRFPVGPQQSAVSPFFPVRRSEDAAVDFCLPRPKCNWELFHLELSLFSHQVKGWRCFVWIALFEYYQPLQAVQQKKRGSRGLQLGWYFLSSFFRISFQHTHRVLLQNHQCIQGLGGTTGVSHLPRDIPTEHQLRL